MPNDTRSSWFAVVIILLGLAVYVVGYLAISSDGGQFGSGGTMRQRVFPTWTAARFYAPMLYAESLLRGTSVEPTLPLVIETENLDSE